MIFCRHRVVGKTFEILYDRHIYVASCFDNLCRNLESFGTASDIIPTTLSVFMNFGVGPDGGLSIDPPTSKASDFIERRAEMDLIVGVTACSAPNSKHWCVQPIDVEIQL